MQQVLLNNLGQGETAQQLQGTVKLIIKPIIILTSSQTFE